MTGRTLLAVFGMMAAGAASDAARHHPRARGTVAPAEAVVTFDREAAVAHPVVVGLMSVARRAGGRVSITRSSSGLLRPLLRLSIGTSLAIAGIAAVAGFLGKLVIQPRCRSGLRLRSWRGASAERRSARGSATGPRRGCCAPASS